MAYMWKGLYVLLTLCYSWSQIDKLGKVKELYVAALNSKVYIVHIFWSLLSNIKRMLSDCKGRVYILKGSDDGNAQNHWGLPTFSIVRNSK
jgi:hypothetical protein